MSTRAENLKAALGLSSSLLGDQAFKVDLNEADYRFLVLSLLDGIDSAVGGGGGGVQRTISITNHTGNFTVAAGKQSIALIFSADFTGTVGTVAFDGSNDSSIDFTAPRGDTLGALVVTVTAGSVRAATTT